MNIVVDIRETSLYDTLVELSKSVAGNITVVSKPLLLGDILIETIASDKTTTTNVLFERKTLSDLLASIRDGRYVEQSHRLIYTSNVPTHNIGYIVEGMYSQIHIVADKQMCISAITTLFYFKGFSVFRTCSIRETAELIFGMAKKIQKELATGKTPRFTNVSSENPPPSSTEQESAVPTYCEVVHKVKKDNITPQNIGEIILCSIPGISSTTAIEIMKHYSSFANFMEEIKTRPEKLNDIHLTTNGKKRKLGKNIIENIRTFLS
jgi:ERCC4-type nuclease